MFWPDLASSNYSNEALKYLSDKKIEMVPKNYNPARCPELRPIEYFWSGLKRIGRPKIWNNYEIILIMRSKFRRIDATRRGKGLECFFIFILKLNNLSI